MKISSLKIVAIIWLSTLLIAACGSKTDILADADSKKAEKVIDELHHLLEQNKYEETHALFTDKFKEVNSWKQIHVVFDSSLRLGEIRKTEVSSSEVTLGAKETINHNIIMNVIRTKINSTEQYHLVQDGDEVKINSFKILAVPFVEKDSL